MTQHTNGSRIVVTGANSRSGRVLLSALGGAATALVRHNTGVQASTVIEDWTASDAAREALAGADIVVHLASNFGAPSFQDYLEGTVATTRIVVQTVQPGTPIVYLSQLGADRSSGNWYERAKGLAEDVLSEASSTIFRISAIVGGRDNPQPFDHMVRGAEAGQPVPIPGDGTQLFRPIHIDDVVAAIVSACRNGGPSGTFDLVGPDTRSMQGWVDLANGAPTATITRTDLPPEIDDLLSRPSAVGDPAAFVEAFPTIALTPWRP